jgi:hypothetical protein
MSMIPDLSQEQMKSNLNASINNAKDTKTADQIREAMSLALSDTESKGIITREEYGEIFQAAFDKNRMVDILDKLHKKQPNTLPTKAARC